MLTLQQQISVETVRALRKLQKEQGIITKRSQNTLLAALSDEDLAVVALELARTAAVQQ